MSDSGYMEQTAVVTSVKDNLAGLEIIDQSGCHSCQMSAGCGTGSLGRLLGYRGQILLLPNRFASQVGDRVIVAISNRAYLLATLLIYLLPLASLFLFSILAQWLWAVDGVTAATALVGLFLGIALSAYLSRRHFVTILQPRIIRQIW